MGASHGQVGYYAALDVSRMTADIVQTTDRAEVTMNDAFAMEVSKRSRNFVKLIINSQGKDRRIIYGSTKTMQGHQCVILGQETHRRHP